jgi:hypothetical protein
VVGGLKWKQYGGPRNTGSIPNHYRPRNTQVESIE